MPDLIHQAWAGVRLQRSAPPADSPDPATAAQIRAELERHAANNRLQNPAPPGSRAFNFRAALRDAVARSGTTTDVLATWTVPEGQRFVVQRRLSMVSASDGSAIAGVSGGIKLYLGASVDYDGSAAPGDVALGPGATGGEWQGATGLDHVFPAVYEPGAILKLEAIVVRPAALTLEVFGALVGYLEPKV